MALASFRQRLSSNPAPIPDKAKYENFLACNSLIWVWQSWRIYEPLPMLVLCFRSAHLLRWLPRGDDLESIMITTTDWTTYIVCCYCSASSGGLELPSSLGLSLPRPPEALFVEAEYLLLNLNIWTLFSDFHYNHRSIWSYNPIWPAEFQATYFRLVSLFKWPWDGDFLMQADPAVLRSFVPKQLWSLSQSSASRPSPDLTFFVQLGFKTAGLHSKFELLSVSIVCLFGHIINTSCSLKHNIQSRSPCFSYIWTNIELHLLNASALLYIRVHTMLCPTIKKNVLSTVTKTAKATKKAAANIQDPDPALKSYSKWFSSTKSEWVDRSMDEPGERQIFYDR